MTPEELNRAVRIAITICGPTGGHRLEGRAILMRCGGWTYLGRCQTCGLDAAGHAHPQGIAGDHARPAGS